MSKSSTTAPSSRPGTSDGLEEPRPGKTSGRVQRPWGLATYYRLRSIALEARVRTLEAELEQREQLRQETIQRYEKLLQRPGEDWVVITNYPSEMDPPAADD
ncbi:MAG: hypothetical protein V5A45_05465 [Haloarculaceae archaeon]